MAAIVSTDEAARGRGAAACFAPRRVTTQPTVPDDRMDMDRVRRVRRGPWPSHARRRRFPLATCRALSFLLDALGHRPRHQRQAGSRAGSSLSHCGVQGGGGRAGLSEALCLRIKNAPVWASDGLVQTCSAVWPCLVSNKFCIFYSFEPS